MIETGIAIMSSILLAVGAFFYLVGAIGLIRMPDVFTRMHANGISDTVGAGFMLVGMMLTAGFTLISAKLFIIILIILFTTPIATHALAQAAMHAGIHPMLKSNRVLGPSRGRKTFKLKQSSGKKSVKNGSGRGKAAARKRARADVK